jgi:hypothetical protein
MERHPFIQKQRMTFRGLVTGLPFVLSYLVLLFIIGRETGGLLTVFLMIAALVAVVVLYFFMTNRSAVSELLMSPCPKCGNGPMRFEPGSEGDYAFICDRCQIEWTLKTPEHRSPS